MGKRCLWPYGYPNSTSTALPWSLFLPNRVIFISIYFGSSTDRHLLLFTERCLTGIRRGSLNPFCVRLAASVNFCQLIICILYSSVFLLYVWYLLSFNIYGCNIGERVYILYIFDLYDSVSWCFLLFIFIVRYLQRCSFFSTSRHVTGRLKLCVNL